MLRPELVSQIFVFAGDVLLQLLDELLHLHNQLNM